MGSIYFICYSARYYLFWIFCILCWCLWTLRGCPQTSFSVFPTIFRYFSCRNKVIYIFYFVQCKLKQIYRCKCSVIIWLFTFRKLVKLVKIMISIPPNTGCIKTAYSYLELICAKRRNKMSISTMATMLFLSVLKQPVRDLSDYEKEIKRMHCGH